MIKQLVYLSVITSLIGASVISLDLGFFQLSIFRLIIIFMTIAILTKILLTNGEINLTIKSENSYSIKFMLFWLAYSVMSIGWVKDYEDWFRAVYFLSLGILCIIIYSRIFKTSKDILRAFRIMAIMVMLHNLIGWYEVNTGIYMFLPTDRIEQYVRGNFPVSMFNNTNDFATFMLISIFITFVCAMNSKIFGKLIYISAMISSIYLLLMTGSRANILGLIFAFAVFVFLAFGDKRGRLTLLVTLTVLFTCILLRPDFLSSFFLLINENLYFRFSEQAGSDGVRTNLIKNGFVFLISTFGFGTGAGNIEYWMGNYGVYQTSGVRNIHNWWMEILTGYGLLVFFLYITFYIKLFHSLYRTYRISKDKINKTLSLGIICSMAGFAIGSVSSSSNISSEWLWVFWGIVIAYQGIKEDKVAINNN